MNEADRTAPQQRDRVLPWIDRSSFHAALGVNRRPKASRGRGHVRRHDFRDVTKRPSLTDGAVHLMRHSDAQPRQKICPYPGALRPCPGGRRKRSVRRHPCRLERVGADLAGVPADHDAGRRDRLLSRHRHAAEALPPEGRRLDAQDRRGGTTQRDRHFPGDHGGVLLGWCRRAAQRAGYRLDCGDHGRLGARCRHADRRRHDRPHPV